jgi:hypothetical protein
MLPGSVECGWSTGSEVVGNHPNREHIHPNQAFLVRFVDIRRHMPVQRPLTSFREARNLGPAFYDRHPEQGNESAFCVEHDDMIALNLSARRDHRLSAYRRILEPYQICFASHFHLPGTSSANGTSGEGRPRAACQWIVLRFRNPYQKGRPPLADFSLGQARSSLGLLIALTSRKYMPHG